MAKFVHQDKGWVDPQGRKARTFEELALARAESIRFLPLKRFWWKLQSMIPLRVQLLIGKIIQLLT